MLEDVVINEDESRSRNVKIVHDIKDYMRNNSEVHYKENRYSSYTLLVLIYVIVLDVLLCIYNIKEDRRMIYMLLALIVVGFVAYYYCSKESKRCKFDAIKKQFGAYDLFVFMLKQDTSTKKIMVSNNRKTIRLYRKLYDIDIENEVFTVEGVGNTVYLIDLDEKYIYVD